MPNSQLRQLPRVASQRSMPSIASSQTSWFNSSAAAPRLPPRRWKTKPKSSPRWRSTAASRRGPSRRRRAAIRLNSSSATPGGSFAGSLAPVSLFAAAPGNPSHRPRLSSPPALLDLLPQLPRRVIEVVQARRPAPRLNPANRGVGVVPQPLVDTGPRPSGAAGRLQRPQPRDLPPLVDGLVPAILLLANLGQRAWLSDSWGSISDDRGHRPLGLARAI